MKHLTPALLRAEPLPGHEGAGSKEARGTVLVVGGSVSVPGGALLAGVAALRAGAGRLQIATCRTVAPMLGLMVPECMAVGLEETAEGGIAPGAAEALLRLAERAEALVLGPGMMDRAATAALVEAVLDQLGDLPMVLDAGALDVLAERPELLRRHAGRVVLTPHTGEMARLLGVERGAVEADKLGHARRAAAALQAVVVMKGAETEIVSPQGEVWRFDGGTVGLATSGSGDTLAGLVGGLLARGAPPARAAMWAVYLHGAAGVRLVERDGGIGFLARELLDEVPRVMGELCRA